MVCYVRRHERLEEAGDEFSSANDFQAYKVRVEDTFSA
jgi:hypothetical protein